MTNTCRRTRAAVALPILAVMAGFPRLAAQTRHTRRATDVAAQLKRAIAKYQDTRAAVADGYRMFPPGVKNQEVFHCTNYGRGFKEAFRFDPSPVATKAECDAVRGRFGASPLGWMVHANVFDGMI